jgi:hypothetical protein
MLIETLANALLAASAATDTGYSSTALSADVDSGSVISTIGGIQIIPPSTKLLTMHFLFSFTTTDD